MKRACWYNLTKLTKDERRIIYAKLDWTDWGIVQIAHNGTYPISKLLIRFCTMDGYLEMLQWIYKQTGIIDEFVGNVSAEYGHLHIIQWARSLDPPIPWNESVCKIALQNGEFKFLDWCVANGAPTNIEWLSFL